MVLKQKIDILNRQPFVDQLIALIDSLADEGKGGVFTIEGNWGCGKSYVLEMLKKQLGVFQNPECANDKYIIFHYNCWQYDFYQEPSIAIIAAIRNEIQKYNSILPELPDNVKMVLHTAKDIGKELLGTVLENKLGLNPFEYTDRLFKNRRKIKDKKSNKNKYDEFFSFKSVLDNTKNELAKLSKEKPVIIIVDELDRCMPEYAIKVLERLHHLFNENDNVIVILAIDRQQIERTIKNVFMTTETQTEVVDKYLKKFIRFSVKLDNGTISEDFLTKHGSFIEKFGGISGAEEKLLNFIISILFKDIEVREQERIMEKISTIHPFAFGDKTDLFVLIFELLYEVTKYRYKTELLAVDLIVRPQYVSVSVPGKNMEHFKKDLIQLQKLSVTNMQLSIGNQEYTKLKEDSLGWAMWILACLQPNTKQEGRYCYPYYVDSDKDMSNYIDCAKKYTELSKIIK